MSEIDKILSEAKINSKAFEMFIAGYKQRVEDNKEGLEFDDKDMFKEHINQAFEEKV